MYLTRSTIHEIGVIFSDNMTSIPALLKNARGRGGGGGGGGLGAGLVSTGAVGNSLTSHIQALQFEPRSRSNVEKLVAAFFRFF